MKIDLNSLFGFDFSVSVLDHKYVRHDTEITNVYKCGDETVYELKCDDESITRIIIKLIRKQSSLCIQAEAVYETPCAWQAKKSFASSGSIRIQLIPSDNSVKVMGSVYSLAPASDCWASGFVADKITDIPNDVASLLWKKDDFYYHMLPLCDGDFKSKIQRGDGVLSVSISPETAGYTNIKAKATVISWGRNPFELPEKSAEAGYDFLGLKKCLRKNKQLPEMFKYIGWCTWDAFSKDVTEEGIINKVREFKEKDIPVKWILIDDGWFKFNEQKLISITEDRSKIPGGLKNLTYELKERYNIKWVGAWQCFTGYWDGIDPNSNLTEQLRECLVKVKSGYIIPRFDEGGCVKFWNTWNDYLSKQGIDFVKVDVENALASYVYDNEAIGKAARESHRALESSVGMYYGGACINCTGMGHESIWNRQGAVNRNSSDFIPQDITTISKFVWNNVMNSFYHGVFYYTDWDMMWTDAVTTKLNTVMHAVSGTLMYISDRVGKSNPDVIKPFITYDGMLLMCDIPGIPSYESLFINPIKEKKLFKAQNKAENSGVIGIFNLNGGEAIRGYISPEDVSYFKNNDTEYLVYDWYNKEMTIMKYDEKADVVLSGYDAKLLTMYPIEERVTVIGLLNKYIPAAAIRRRISCEEKEIISIIDGGIFAYRCEAAHDIYINGKICDSYNCGKYSTVDCSGYAGEIFIEIAFRK